MATPWMRAKLAKLKIENGKRMQEHNSSCEVNWYATSKQPKAGKTRPAGVNKQEMQELVGEYKGQIKKYETGYALYGKNTFAKRNGVCTRGTWGRN